MEYQSIEVCKLTPSIGAEIFGVDLGSQIGNQQFQAIHQALMENLVIFFRDQKMTAEQHKDFGARFGKLHIHPNAPKLIEGHPEILVIKADENSKRVAGEVWHSDVSCDEEPPMGSILHIHEVPANGGGDTSFANMYAAYDALSDTMKRFLEGCTAIHASLKKNPPTFSIVKRPPRCASRSRSTRWSGHIRKPATRRSTSIAVSQPAYPSLRTLKATPCWRCCSVTPSRPGFIAGSSGSRTRSPFGTTGRRCIRPCGITIRNGVMGTG